MRILQGPVAWDMTLTAFGTPTGEGSKSSIEENPDPRWGKRRDLNGWHRHRFTGSDARDFGEEGWERKTANGNTFYRNTRRFGERVFRSRPAIRAGWRGCNHGTDTGSPGLMRAISAKRAGRGRQQTVILSTGTHGVSANECSVQGLQSKDGYLKCPDPSRRRVSQKDGLR